MKKWFQISFLGIAVLIATSVLFAEGEKSSSGVITGDRVNVRAVRRQLGVGVVGASVESAIRDHRPDAVNVLTGHRGCALRLDRVFGVAHYRRA